MLGWGEGVERVRQRRNKREKALGREIWKQRLRFASFLSYPPPPPPPPLSRLVFFPLSAPPRREHIANRNRFSLGRCAFGVCEMYKQ